MARPGKAIFDVTMMAGWAFAAMLTGLLALTVVDETGDSATDSGVVATLEEDDARLLTGSVPENPMQNGDRQGNDRLQRLLMEQQNRSFDPFNKKIEVQSEQLKDVMAELRSLKREVAAFHVTTKRLRNDNNLLKQRLAKLELGKKSQSDPADPVRVIELPKRPDSGNPILSVNRGLIPSAQSIDPNATGSIAPVAPVPIEGQSFDPFKKQSQPRVKVRDEPFNMDLTVEGPGGRMMLPKAKTVGSAGALTNHSGLRKPASEVIAAPVQTKEASRTAFGVDLGQFVSLSDLGSAWKEIGISQRELVGDLKPLSRITQINKDRLALNLILGPMQNAAQAATLCARLKQRGYGCKVSVYQGQALALR